MLKFGGIKKINLGWGSVGGGCSWIVRMCVLAEERKVSCERITLHGEAICYYSYHFT